jgi:hypothetical protein
MRFVALTMLVACVAGCKTVDPADLLGRDEAYVVKALGTPEFREEGVKRPADMPAMGPSPPRLQPGDRCIVLKYVFNWRDEKWYVFLASPAVYERIHGTKPITATSDCVIQVQKYPKDAVF